MPPDFPIAQQLAVSRALPRIARMIDKELTRAGARAAIAETLERWGEISDTPFDKEISS